MKLKDIISILKRSRHICLFKGSGCQWLSDGYGAYPIDGLPELSKGNIRALIDVDDNQWDGYHVSEDTLPFDESNYTEEDILLSDTGMLISYSGNSVVPFLGGGKLFYIQLKYLKPFINDKSDYIYYARKTNGGGYVIAVSEGFFLRGFIMPYRCIDEKYIKTLKTVAALSSDLPLQNKDADWEN